MTPQTEETLESCWSFPHHLKLGVRLRNDGEPVLFIVSAPDEELSRMPVARRRQAAAVPPCEERPQPVARPSARAWLLGALKKLSARLARVRSGDPRAYARPNDLY